MKVNAQNRPASARLLRLPPPVLSRTRFPVPGTLRRFPLRSGGAALAAGFAIGTVTDAQFEPGFTENGWIVTAEVFGKGIEMWLNSQRNCVKVQEENRRRSGRLCVPQRIETEKCHGRISG